jgi:hypothetical protein
MILLISASHIARVTGMSHQHPAPWNFLLLFPFSCGLKAELGVGLEASDLKSDPLSLPAGPLYAQCQTKGRVSIENKKKKRSSLPQKQW